ncbi:hypothetical protein F0562_023916 [Nyssa sinensis]|uniref:Uncharacterized protein n=1 Tax=Nyssa sinensis TaxID=561372 RepID=A0A5J5BJ66_9ASTE|nr:hypothetical protein F0562_023916 [Nyssa sinensis]
MATTTVYNEDDKGSDDQLRRWRLIIDVECCAAYDGQRDALMVAQAMTVDDCCIYEGGYGLTICLWEAVNDEGALLCRWLMSMNSSSDCGGGGDVQ